MIREQLKQAAALMEALQNAAYDTINRHNEICDELDVKNYRLVSGEITEVFEDGVTISWYESWSYGGYDEGEYTLTDDELDPETREDTLRAKLEACVAKQREADERSKAFAENQERSILAELKKKYPESA